MRVLSRIHGLTKKGLSLSLSLYARAKIERRKRGEGIGRAEKKEGEQ